MKLLTMYIRAMMVVSCCMTMFFMQGQHPTTTLAAYHNKISHISYSLSSHDQHAITLVCQQSPICIYTPLSYEAMAGDDVTKTFFLPRTELTDSQMRYFYEDLQNAVAVLGIGLQIESMKKANYGLRMSFTMPSDHSYDIMKVVNADTKTVSFNIVAKI